MFALDVALNEIHPDAVKLEEKKKEAAGYQAEKVIFDTTAIAQKRLFIRECGRNTIQIRQRKLPCRIFFQKSNCRRISGAAFNGRASRILCGYFTC